MYLSGPDKVQQNTLWCHWFLCIKNSFNFKKFTGKYSFTDTQCTVYPTTTKGLWAGPFNSPPVEMPTPSVIITKILTYSINRCRTILWSQTHSCSNVIWISQYLFLLHNWITFNWCDFCQTSKCELCTIFLFLEVNNFKCDKYWNVSVN